MLPPETDVLTGRKAFADAQVAMNGALQRLGNFTVGWYGTDISDERGSFGLVNPTGPLINFVGDFLFAESKGRGTFVYIIGSHNALVTDLAITRRAFMELAVLADDPLTAKVSVRL